MSVVVTHPHKALGAVALDTLKAAKEEASKDPGSKDSLRGQSRKVGSIPLMRRRWIHLALAASYTVDNGRHSSHKWSKHFEYEGSAVFSPKKRIREYEPELEKCIAASVGFGDERPGERPAKTTPLNGQYHIYTIAIHCKTPFSPEEVFYIGTICVYSPPERDGKKCISLDVSPLYDLFLDWCVNRKTMRSMRDHCVDELHRFAKQLGIDKKHQAVSKLDLEPDRETDLHLVAPPH
ncbi:hypothetical protein HG444_000410 [Candidatus Saccharibacteria bacterium]|nr:hypothetical protein [Candidatus Saccharibacteria bacterium]